MNYLSTYPGWVTLLLLLIVSMAIWIVGIYATATTLMILKKKTLVARTCSICDETVKGSFTTTGNDEVAHTICYDKAHPPKIKKSFSSVLTNCDDQVLVRELLIHMVPPAIQQDITEAFNKTIQSRHKDRIS